VIIRLPGCDLAQDAPHNAAKATAATPSAAATAYRSAGDFISGANTSTAEIHVPTLNAATVTRTEPTEYQSRPWRRAVMRAGLWPSRVYQVMTRVWMSSANGAVRSTRSVRVVQQEKVSSVVRLRSAVGHAHSMYESTVLSCLLGNQAGQYEDYYRVS
jgi:hypothetical protein